MMQKELLDTTCRPALKQTLAKKTLKVKVDASFNSAEYALVTEGDMVKSYIR